MITPELHRDIELVQRLSSVPSILKVIAELTGMRVTMVARVTPNSWTACAAYDQMEFGLKVGTQLDVATTLCKEVTDRDETIIIPNVSQDDIYRHHQTPKLYNLGSYFAIPIHSHDGSVFGTLCGIDREPTDLSSKITTTLTHFAKLVSSQMQLEESRVALDRSLVEERRVGQLREEFIAILGHDLRNPLNGISINVDLLHEMRDEPPLPAALDGLRGSVDQMSQLIEQTMDFARTRLGHGVVLNRENVPDLVELARACAQELSSSGQSSKFEIRAEKAFSAKVDPVRLRQILSNLMGNAVHHGASGRPVTVEFTETAGNVRVTIHNEGKPIADEMMAVLFEPFHRSSSHGSRQGLGLGLYIAFQLTRAHGGNLLATSDATGTTFTVLLPAGTYRAV